MRPTPLETEFKAEGEQKEDHADVRPGMNTGRVDDGGREGEMRAGDEAGHNITQHQRLAQFLENQGHYAGADENERQVSYEGLYFCHESRNSMKPGMERL